MLRVLSAPHCIIACAIEPTLPLRYRWSDLQDFGIQSSQIGPHLVQPFISSPNAITHAIKPTRRNIVHHSRTFHHIASDPSLSSRADVAPATQETFRHGLDAKSVMSGL
jgi:hypothetical protein